MAYNDKLRNVLRALPQVSLFLMPVENGFRILEATDAFMDFSQISREDLYQLDIANLPRQLTQKGFDNILSLLEESQLLNKKVIEPPNDKCGVEVSPVNSKVGEIDHFVLTVIPADDGNHNETSSGNGSAAMKDTIREAGGYHVLFDSLPIAIYAINAEGTIIFHNTAAEQLWGRKPKPGKGQWCGFLEVMDPDNYSKVPVEDYPITRLMKNGENPGRIETLIKRPDGSELWVMTNPVSILNEGGKLVGAINMVLDISEEKAVQLELREHKRMLQQSERLAGMGSWEADLVDHKLFWTEGMYRLLGLDPYGVEPSLDLYKNMLHPDDLARFEEELDRFMEERQPMYSHQYRIVLPDGRCRMFHSFGEILYDENSGQSAAIYGTIQDITEKYEAEERLRNREHELNESQRLSNTGSWEWDLNNDVITCSKQMYRMFGYEPFRLNLNFEKICNVIHPEDRQPFVDRVKNFKKQGDSYRHEYRICHNDGSVRLINSFGEILKDSNGNIMKMRGIVEDITDKRAREEKLLRSQKMLAESQRIAGLGHWQWEVGSDTITWSEGLCRLYGIKPEDANFTFAEFLTFVPSSDHENIRTTVQEALKSGNPYTFRHRILRRDGVIRYHRSQGEVIRDSKGNVVILRGVSQDITRELEEQDQIRKLSFIAEHTTNAISITDANGLIEWTNGAFTRLTGYLEEELVGKKIREVLYGEDTDKSVVQFRESRIERRQSYKCELLKYDKLRRPFWVQVEGHPLLDKEGRFTHYFEMYYDITEKKKSFQQLLQSHDDSKKFARQLNEVLEEERARIARELHDELGQKLSGIMMSASVLNSAARAGNTTHVVNEVLNGLDESIHLLRNIATELRPGILDTMGLIPSLEWLVEQFEMKTGIDSHYQCNGEVRNFDKATATGCFRICQEALNNVGKHSRASNVEVILSFIENDFYLQIKDDGIGLDRERILNPFSMGIISMQERANIIGGNFTITSEEGIGTTVKVKIKIG